MRPLRRVSWSVENLHRLSQLAFTLLLLPSIALHELAHVVALLPYGGPDAIVLVTDPAETRGPVPRTPAAVGVWYDYELQGAHQALVALAPFVYIVPLLVFLPLETWLTSVAGFVLMWAWFPAVFDALELASPQLYDDWFDPGDWELHVLLDFTPWTGRGVPPATHGEAAR